MEQAPNSQAQVKDAKTVIDELDDPDFYFPDPNIFNLSLGLGNLKEGVQSALTFAYNRVCCKNKAKFEHNEQHSPKFYICCNKKRL